MKAQRLMQIKSQIEDAKTRQAEIKGQISGIIEQMKAKFKVADLPEAEKRLESMGADLDEKERQFQEGMSQLEEAYDWE
jgi:chromosome segregation ATPase